MRLISRMTLIFLSMVFIFMIYWGIPDGFVASDPHSYAISAVTTSPQPLKDEKMFSDEEVEAIARPLAGVCYDNTLADKRKVTEVILNRVSDGRFGENVIDVLSAPGQFCGYWKQSRMVSNSDIQIAEETLTDWYENENEALSEYLFFCAGPNRENIFR